MNIILLLGATLTDNLPKTQADAGTLSKVFATLYLLIGALSVIFIIIGGIKYILSAGDSSKLTGAKNTILYAVVGLVVAILAFAITNFVLARINGGSFEELRNSIIQTLLFLAGSLAVIMIVFGGFKYVTSNGDSSKVQSAKNTILYAVIGLLVSVIAFAIVNFVLRSI